MKDVSDKIDTSRVARASATVRATPESVELVRRGGVPKGDVLETARIAGIMAAKKTSGLLPLCHPIPVDQVSIEFHLSDNAIVITSTVKAIWKTGVEMEALTSAAVSALTVYDMLKPIDHSLAIESVRLIEKKGGKSSFKDEFEKPLRAGVLVISDSTYAGKRKDKSGQLIVERLKESAVEVVKYEILPDDADMIRDKIVSLAETEKVDLVLTTGGTGLGPKDVTVEATRTLIDREIPAIAEAARAYGQKRTPYSMLSRGIAGTRGQTLIINLPGSSNGAREYMSCLFPSVLHAFKMMWGGGHRE